MKTNFIFCVICMLCLGSIFAEAKVKTTKGLENDKVNIVEQELSGIEMAESVSEDGTKIVKRPYHWYRGTASASNQQIAIEMAQRAAMNSIARSIATEIKDKAEETGVINNGAVMSAIKTHWMQKSAAMIKGCQPFGKAEIQYDKATKMYKVTARVAIPHDKFMVLMGDATAVPSSLNEDEVQQFIDANQSIFDAVLGDVEE